MKSFYRFLHNRKVFKSLTEQEFAWVLYDVGNSAFTMLACSLLPIWFKGLAVGNAPGQISGSEATAFYSASISIVTLIIAFFGPVFGALADRKNKKKIIFTTATALGVIACLINGFSTSWIWFLGFAVITRINNNI